MDAEGGDCGAGTRCVGSGPRRSTSKEPLPGLATGVGRHSAKHGGLLILLSLALISCGGGNAGKAAGTGEVVAAATWRPIGGGSFLAGTEGLLAVESGCLSVKASDTNTIVVFDERRYTWDQERKLLIRDNSTTFALGDTISLTGGFLTLEQGKGVSASFDVPASCGAGADRTMFFA